MQHKEDIDREVALAIARPYAEVRRTTSAFLDRLALALAVYGEVELRQFAWLTTKVITTNSGCAKAQHKDGTIDKIYVRVHKKPCLKRLLAEHHNKEK
jgi:hypothetical protein